MRILALETTDPTGSVAAIDGRNLLAKLMLEKSQRSARSLAPAMNALLQQVGWSPRDVELVAVSIGPGSFTGIRVGAATAKVFAYSIEAQVLGVDTLEIIAAGSCCLREERGERREESLLFPSLPASNPQSPIIAAAIDAQRGDVVAQQFTGDSPETLRAVSAQELMPADAWLAQLTPNTIATGPALSRWADRLTPNIPRMDPSVWYPKAEFVGRLAARYYEEGRRDDLWRLTPRYCRRSAAEEKWEALGK